MDGVGTPPFEKWLVASEEKSYSRIISATRCSLTFLKIEINFIKTIERRNFDDTL